MEVVKNHLHCSLTLLGRVTLRHALHPSQRTKRDQTRDGSDIAACFDELAHSAIMERVRLRMVDKRVLASIKAFLKAGIISSDGTVRHSDTGTPQGGILSPLLANIALTVLDAYFCAKWDSHGSVYRREVHRKHGGATYRIVRYPNDFAIMVIGTRAHPDALWDEAADVIAPSGAAVVR